MAITDRKFSKDAKSAIKEFVIALVTAVGQADVKAFSYLPGFEFEIVGVQVYCLNLAGNVSADVKIGAASALVAGKAFVAATRGDAALAAALASRRGKATDVLNVHYTSDGAGALTNGFVVVQIRPRGLVGEAE